MVNLIPYPRLFPEWGAKKEFINAHLERVGCCNLSYSLGNSHFPKALALDARRSSHPIEVPCDDAKKVNQIFDALSYSKAGSGNDTTIISTPTEPSAVLRMLSDFVTEEKFLKGVVSCILYE